MKILITSGGTKIPIDRVRHIQNMSSGTFGSAIASSALQHHHSVDFLMAKHSKSPFKKEIDFTVDNIADILFTVGNSYEDYVKFKDNYKEFQYEDFQSYLDILEVLVKGGRYDAVILAAAVSDYGVENVVDGKIRSKDSDMVIKLKSLPKIISRVKQWDPKVVLVGFKLLVDSTKDELVQAARNSINDNGCNLVIANDLRDIKNNKHSICLVTSDGVDYVCEPTQRLANSVISATQIIFDKIGRGY